MECIDFFKLRNKEALRDHVILVGSFDEFLNSYNTENLCSSYDCSLFLSNLLGKLLCSYKLYRNNYEHYFSNFYISNSPFLFPLLPCFLLFLTINQSFASISLILNPIISFTLLSYIYLSVWAYSGILYLFMVLLITVKILQN